MKTIMGLPPAAPRGIEPHVPLAVDPVLPIVELQVAPVLVRVPQVVMVQAAHTSSTPMSIPTTPLPDVNNAPPSPPGNNMKEKIDGIIARSVRLHDLHPRQPRGLSDQDITEVTEHLSAQTLDWVDAQGHTQIGAPEYALIDNRVKARVEQILAGKLRFRKRARVVCNVGNEWLSGMVTAVNDATQHDQTFKYPYVVKLDEGDLITAPVDEHDTIRAEICFGRCEDSTLFTLFCLPSVCPSRARRFACGERVACAVENSVPALTGTMWAPGTVEMVDRSMEEAAKMLLAEEILTDKEWSKGCVPYQVKMDAGYSVLVHKDVHWLIRDLAHQVEGPRQAEDGSCCLTSIEKRQREDGGWEMVDHTTRGVRKCAKPDSSAADDI